MTFPLQPFFDLSPQLLAIRDQEGFFVAINHQWLVELGWTLEALKTRPWWQWVHPSDRSITEDMDEYCRKPSALQSIELQHRFLDGNGNYRWLSWRLSPFQEGLSYGIAEDITGRTWQGSQLFRIEIQSTVKLLDQAISASCVGIVIADARLADMPLIYVNPAFERITGYHADEVLGTNCRFLQGKNNQQPALIQLRKAIKEGKDCKVILQNYRKNGTPFWNELSISPIYNDDGILTHFIGVQSDISDRIRAEKALRLEKAKSEGLLLNILPRPIAEELKKVRSAVAQQFSSATILFADIVGFTAWSSHIPPLEIINYLNEIFSLFDQLTDKYQVEKIKTIGDAYMVAGGIPIVKDNHLESMANLALEMLQVMEDLRIYRGFPLEIRIGINTGSVVAGVIGMRKFIYDLWGDAVNVASRMESSGIAGKIQVTETVYELLKDQFSFEKRGEINIKGKGLMTTYWLLDQIT